MANCLQPSDMTRVIVSPISDYALFLVGTILIKYCFIEAMVHILDTVRG